MPEIIDEMGEIKDRKKTGAELVNPYDGERAKSEQVEEMFDSIAPAYDFMNRAMSFGQHLRWRKKALDALSGYFPDGAAEILDVATGTGDVAFDLRRRYPSANVTGVDLSEGMLSIARKKLAGMSREDRDRMKFLKGDSLALDFADDSFDIATVAYGVRNFEDLEAGLREIRRVLRKDGVLCIIELSEPENRVMHSCYRLYSRHLIPFAGRLVSGDSRAYSYLPESIAAAPQRRNMAEILRKTGFGCCSWMSLTFGVVTFYLAHNRKSSDR